MRFFATIFFCCLVLGLSAQLENLWALSEKGIQWEWDSLKMNIVNDNIEMAGLQVAGIIHYSVDSTQTVEIKRDIIFPQHHPLLKSTDKDWWIYRSYLRDVYTEEQTSPKIYLGNREIVFNKVEKIEIDGIISFSYQAAKNTKISLVRSFFPDTEEAAFYEQWTLKNNDETKHKLQVIQHTFSKNTITTEGEVTVYSSNTMPNTIDLDAGEEQSFTFGIAIRTKNINHDSRAYEKRQDLLNQWKNQLVFSSPDKNIDRLFEFSKIRGSESIFESKMGRIHSPGGGRYYVGFWANDQAEYINPLFPFLGYEIGIESSINCYDAFAKEMNDEYKMLRYAFEIEGTVPAFYLDRGDAAMIAYGASQFALFNADKKQARQLWPLIEWCLEYCHRKLNIEGVVTSESDEMEGRIETGDANLSTSSLYYGALTNSYYLAKELNLQKKQIRDYKEEAELLRTNINEYFGGIIEGLDTYRYYKGHENLRHWICMPLVMGITEKKDGTIDALFDKLWSENGVHVEKNNPDPKISDIFWDRGTLYALRGTFIAGATEKSLEKLQEYTEKRLLQDRVPYAVEAYPEGSMAHLSAESGLYCRIITEGMFGIIPTGFKSFEFTPHLPAEWDHMNLDHIRAFGSDFSIHIVREGKKIKATVKEGNRLVLDEYYEDGESLVVSL